MPRVSKPLSKDGMWTCPLVFCDFEKFARNAFVCGSKCALHFAYVFASLHACMCKIMNCISRQGRAARCFSNLLLGSLEASVSTLEDPRCNKRLLVSGWFCKTFQPPSKPLPGIEPECANSARIVSEKCSK